MHHPGPRLEFDTRTDIELDALLASQIKSMRVDDMALSPDCTVRIAHRSHEGTVEIRIRIDLPFDDAAALAAPGVLGICVRRRLIEGWTGRPLAAFTITAGLARLAIDARVETSSASSFVRMVVDAVSDLPFASSELQLAYGAVARRMDIDRLTIDEVALLELRTRMFDARSMEAMTDSVRHLASHAATDVCEVFAEALGRARWSIVFVGDVPTDAVSSLASLESSVPASGRATVRPKVDAVQADRHVNGVTGVCLRCGLVAPGPAGDEYVPAMLATMILGSPVDSRLFRSLRLPGFTYVAEAAMEVDPGGGVVIVAAEPNGRTLRQVRAILREELSAMSEIAGCELFRAGRAAAGALSRSFTSAGGLAARLLTVPSAEASAAYYIDFLQRLRGCGIYDVERVASAWFTPENLVSVAVGATDEPPMSSAGRL